MSECKSCVIARSVRSRRVRVQRNPAKYLLIHARHRASLSGLPFDLTEADVVVPARCPVLGLTLRTHTGRAAPDSPSLDRIIPERGYVPGNVEVISWRANSLKKDATLEELEALVDYLARRVPPKQTRRKVRNPA